MIPYIHGNVPRYDPDKDDDEDENEVAVVNPKSDEQRTRLNAACNKVLLFNRYVRDTKDA